MCVFKDTASCSVTIQIPTVKYTYRSVINSEHKRAINPLGLVLLGFVLKEFKSGAQYESIRYACFTRYRPSDLLKLFLFQVKVSIFSYVNVFREAYGT